MKYEFRWLIKPKGWPSWDINVLIQDKIERRVLQVRIINDEGNSIGWQDIPSVTEDWEDK